MKKYDCRVDELRLIGHDRVQIPDWVVADIAEEAVREYRGLSEKRKPIPRDYDSTPPGGIHHVDLRG